MPTASAITQARKRFGWEVFVESFERCRCPVAVPAGPAAENVAPLTARLKFLRWWPMRGIDGFEIDVADSSENAASFGYAGSGANRRRSRRRGWLRVGRVRYPRLRNG